MTKPQHLCLLALISAANGLTTLPFSSLQREPTRTYSSTALNFQDDAFVDVEILSHQKIRRFRPTETPGIVQDRIASPTETKSTYREIRIPMEWYPEQRQMEDTKIDDDPSACSAYRRKECEQTESTVMVKILEWKKKTGDIVREGDTMVILEKSQIDSYGRSLDKQRIEVASKEDGILKSVLIPQNKELDLSKHQTRSLLALFHPTLFHCIDIDESTRMDTTLLLEEETVLETQLNDSMDTTTSKEEESKVSTATVDIAPDVNGSCCESNITGATHHRVEEFKGIMEDEEEKPPTTMWNRSLDIIDQEVHKRSVETAECKETMDAERPTKSNVMNATLEIGHKNAKGESTTTACATFQEEEDLVSQELITEKEPFSPLSKAFLSVDQKADEGCGEIPEGKREIAEATILENHESVSGGDDLTAAEQIIINNNNHVVSSIQKSVDDQELDVEWIVDTAAKVVRDVMFTENTENYPISHKENPSSIPDTDLLKKAVGETPQDIEKAQKEPVQEMFSTHEEDVSIGQPNTNVLQSEEVSGSQKTEIFDMILDFFSVKRSKDKIEHSTSCDDKNKTPKYL